MEIETFKASGLLKSYADGLCTPEDAALVAGMLAQYPALRTELQALRAPAAPDKSHRFFQLFSVILGALAFLYFFKFNQANETAAAAVRDLSDTKASLQQCLDYGAKNQRIFAILRDRDTRPVLLSDGSGKIGTWLYYNDLRQEVGLDIAGLPIPPDGRFYQLWATVNNVPVSMGMIDLTSRGSWQEIPYMANATGYAISHEDNPKGVPRPTMVILNSDPK